MKNQTKQMKWCFLVKTSNLNDQVPVRTCYCILAKSNSHTQRKPINKATLIPTIFFCSVHTMSSTSTCHRANSQLSGRRKKQPAAINFSSFRCRFVAFDLVCWMESHQIQTEKRLGIYISTANTPNTNTNNSSGHNTNIQQQRTEPIQCTRIWISVRSAAVT